MAELGILLRSFYPIQVSTELVQEAERRGFHSVWITEGVDKDAYTQLAIWATKTERILMGSAITPVYTRTQNRRSHSHSSIDDTGPLPTPAGRV